MLSSHKLNSKKPKKTGHICCPPENDSPRNLHNDKASDLPGAMGTTCRESKEMMSVTTCWRHDHPDGIVSCSFSQEGQTMPDSCSLKYRLFQPSRKGGKMALTTNLVSNLEQPWCSSTYWPACNNFVFFLVVQNAPPTAHSCKQAPEPSCRAIVSTPCPNGIWRVHSKAPHKSKVH